jgi:hypothetical protein
MVISDIDEADLRCPRLGHKWLLSICAISMGVIKA